MENKKDIKRVGLIGAGGVGCYVVAPLCKKLGSDFVVLAEGPRKERLQKEGLWINQEQIFPQVVAPAEAGELDLLLVAVKYNGLPDILPMVQKAVGPQTTVISLMNGIDTEDILSQVVPQEQILPAFIVVGADRQGNRINIRPTKSSGGIFCGELGPEKRTPRTQALEALFADTTAECHISQDISFEIWQKFAINVSNNLTQAILQCPFSAFRKSQHVNWVREALWSEVVAVAKTYGVTLPATKAVPGEEDFLDDWRCSTLQDVLAGRPSEVEAFAGAMVRMGQEKGIPTPVCQVAYHMLWCLDEMNQGMYTW